jgi:hypothetical protein
MLRSNPMKGAAMDKVRLVMRQPPFDTTLEPGTYFVKMALRGELAFERVDGGGNAHRCETCKWWEPADRDVAPPGVRNSADRWQPCGLADSQDGRPVHPQALAVADDGETYAAGLWTRADFGCVQWEAAHAANSDASPANRTSPASAS